MPRLEFLHATRGFKGQSKGGQIVPSLVWVLGERRVEVKQIQIPFGDDTKKNKGQRQMQLWARRCFLFLLDGCIYFASA